MFGVGSQALRASAQHNAQHGTTRITDEMYARIPALLEQGMTKAEIAAMFGVTLGSLGCAARGVASRCARAGRVRWCYRSATTY